MTSDPTPGLAQMATSAVATTEPTAYLTRQEAGR